MQSVHEKGRQKPEAYNKLQEQGHILIFNMKKLCYNMWEEATVKAKENLSEEKAWKGLISDTLKLVERHFGLYV